MIRIKVLESPDPDALGLKYYNKNNISIGVDQGDVFIRDSNITNYHITLDLQEDGLFIHTHRDNPYFHLNGKKTSGIVRLIKNDTIKIGSTTLFVEDFSMTYHLSKNDELKSRLKHLMAQNSPLLEVLKKIEQDINDET